MDSFFIRCPRCDRMGAFDPARMTAGGEVRCPACHAPSPIELLEFINPELGTLRAVWLDQQRRYLQATPNVRRRRRERSAA